MSHHNKGFGLLELLIVISILSILLALTTSSLFGAQYKATLTASISTLVSDLNHQRLRAMTGDTDGEAVAKNYGIYFQTDNYVLFSGSSYDPDNTTNFVVPLGDGVNFLNNLFTQSQIVFTAGSGEIVNFSGTANSISIRNTLSAEQKTLTINQLGTITNVN